MPKIKVEQIEGALGHLSEEELTRVRRALDFLGAKSSTTQPTRTSTDPLEDNFVIFYRSLVELMAEHGISIAKNAQVLDRGRLSKLQHAWMAADDYIALAFKGQSVRTRQRLQLYDVIIRVVADYLLELDIPLTVGSISSQMRNNCGSLMNRQFPGYTQAGLMSIAMKWGKVENKED